MLPTTSHDGICHEGLEYYGPAAVENVSRQAQMKILRTCVECQAAPYGHLQEHVMRLPWHFHDEFIERERTLIAIEIVADGDPG
jgi:hypothetical protein